MALFVMKIEKYQSNQLIETLPGKTSRDREYFFSKINIDR